MDVIKKIFGNFSAPGEVLGSVGPLLLAILFLVLSFILARLVKKFLASFLKQVLSEEKRGLAEKWSMLIFWFIFFGAVLLLGGFLYNTLALAITKSSATQKFGAYFSRFISALIIFLIGIVLGGLTKRIVLNTLSRLKYRNANTLSRVAGIAIASLFAIVAVEQLNIHIDLIRNLILIMVLLIGLSFSLSLGLGAKAYSANIISGNHIRRTYLPGMHITMGDYSGIIISVDAVATIIETVEKSRVVFPNNLIMSSIVTICPAKSHG